MCCLLTLVGGEEDAAWWAASWITGDVLAFGLFGLRCVAKKTAPQWCAVFW